MNSAVSVTFSADAVGLAGSNAHNTSTSSIPSRFIAVSPLFPLRRLRLLLRSSPLPYPTPPPGRDAVNPRVPEFPPVPSPSARRAAPPLPPPPPPPCPEGPSPLWRPLWTGRRPCRHRTWCGPARSRAPAHRGRAERVCSSAPWSMQRWSPRPRASYWHRSAHSRPRSLTPARSEEHTSELQSHSDLVCRLLLEKKKQK